MIIKLKNDGGFSGLEGVAFPVTIEAAQTSLDGGYRVYGRVLQAINGVDAKHFDADDHYVFFNHEVEVIEE